MRCGLLLSALVGGTLCMGAVCVGASAAHATVQVAIDLTHQRMHIRSDEGSYDWPISSARSGFYTPGGSFAPTHLELMHYSHKYHMSPMPHAIFFRGGYAIHGSYATGSLGRPASHGCVRLSPANATTLYNMVKAEGARISISGTPPATPRTYYASARPRTQRVGGGYADQPYDYDPYGYDRSYGRGYDGGDEYYGLTAQPLLPFGLE